jgi:hypothetical protein
MTERTKEARKEKRVLTVNFDLSHDGSGSEQESGHDRHQAGLVPLDIHCDEALPSENGTREGRMEGCGCGCGW